MEENTTPKPVKLTNYQTNSHKSKETEAEKVDRPKMEQVTKSAGIQRKKSLGSKFMDAFTGDDATSVGNYIVFEVVLPAAKNMLVDAISQGAERFFGGSVRPRSSSFGSGGVRSGYTSYNKLYGGGQNRRPEETLPGGRGISRRAMASHDFGEIIIGTRGEAEEVIERLGDLIDVYGIAKVSDLYDLVGITGSYVDDKWGWTSMAGSVSSRVRDGYMLVLPATVQLD